MIGCLRCFRWFVLAVLGHFSEVWLSAAKHTLNYWTDSAVSGARLLTGNAFESDIAHRRSVAVLCMLYKIR